MECCSPGASSVGRRRGGERIQAGGRRAGGGSRGGGRRRIASGLGESHGGRKNTAASRSSFQTLITAALGEPDGRRPGRRPRRKGGSVTWLADTRLRPCSSPLSFDCSRSVRFDILSRPRYPNVPIREWRAGGSERRSAGIVAFSVSPCSARRPPTRWKQLRPLWGPSCACAATRTAGRGSRAAG